MYSIVPYKRFHISEADFDSKEAYIRALRPQVESLGRRVKSVRPSLHHYFKSVLTPREPSFTGSILLEQYDGFDKLISWSKRYQEVISNSGLEQGLVEAELDNVTKITLLTGNSGSNHIEPDGFITDHEVDIPTLIPVSRLLMSLMDDDRSTLVLTTARGTNHGWPTNIPGSSPINSVDMIAHIKMSSQLMDKFDGDLDAYADHIKTQSGIPEPMGASMFFRSQPTSKPTHIYGLTNLGPEYKYSEYGKWCRLRQVFGVPLFINTSLRPAAQQLKRAYRSLPNFYHTTPENTLRFLREFKEFTWFSEDISGYDKSVSYDLQIKVADHLYSQFMSAQELTLYKRTLTLGVLGPPMKTGDEGFMYNRKGQTMSGSIFTDKDGSLFNFIRICECVVAATGWTPDAVISKLNIEWAPLVFGDDCVIGYGPHVSFSREKYRERSLELGFKTEAMEGVVFLMNYYNTKENYYHGILARAMDKTVNKEYVTLDPILTAFGDGARWSRMQAHPLVKSAFERIQGIGWYNKIGVRSIHDLQNIMTDPTVSAYLVTQSQDAQKAAKVRDMMAGLTHGSLNLEDLANTPLSPSFLTAMEKILVGLSTSDSQDSELGMLSQDISEGDLYEYITWSQEMVGKPELVDLISNKQKN